MQITGPLCSSAFGDEQDRLKVAVIYRSMRMRSVVQVRIYLVPGITDIWNDLLCLPLQSVVNRA